MDCTIRLLLYYLLLLLFHPHIRVDLESCVHTVLNGVERVGSAHFCMNFLGDQMCLGWLLWLPHDMPYRDACSRSHIANNKALGAKYQDNQVNSTRVTRAATKMAKAPSCESSPDLSSHFSAMSLEERELKVWKEIEAMELEECVADLEAKRDAMKRRYEERLRCSRCDDSEEEGRLRLHAYGTVGTAGMAALSSKEAELGHSDYGHSRSRQRSKNRNHL